MSPDSRSIIGAITDEQARTSSVSLGFLTPKRSFVATVYADAADAKRLKPYGR